MAANWSRSLAGFELACLIKGFCELQDAKIPVVAHLLRSDEEIDGD